MPNEGRLGASIRAFFESDDTRDLFRSCPLRQHLPHLHEFDAAEAYRVLYHMLGHILDYKAGQPCRNEDGEMTWAISQDDIGDQLRYIYNDCNNIKLNEARRVDADVEPHDRPEYHGFGPEQRGYHGADARAELMAEAFRAYLQDPNYIKTVAPNVAARIRAAVNPNPSLNTIIQFN